MVIDYEIEDIINMEVGEITNHIYFTAPLKIKTDELKYVLIKFLKNIRYLDTCIIVTALKKTEKNYQPLIL